MAMRPTLTHALLFYSPAINAGDPNFNLHAFNPPLLNDQRSGPEFPRVVNGRVDIGAYEFKNPNNRAEFETMQVAPLCLTTELSRKPARCPRRETPTDFWHAVFSPYFSR
jgi:hypothetical protein